MFVMHVDEDFLRFKNYLFSTYTKVYKNECIAQLLIHYTTNILKSVIVTERTKKHKIQNKWPNLHFNTSKFKLYNLVYLT